MKLIYLITLFLFLSCSVKQDDKTVHSPHQEIDPISGGGTISAPTNIDSDGDTVLDQEERNLGRNPYIADIPRLDIRFLQNFSIVGSYKAVNGKAKGQFKIDTTIGEADPDFKYRVGSIFARHNAYNKAASIGVFSTHNYGAIREFDLSWVKYPEIDPTFFHREALKNRKYFGDDYKLTSLSVKLDNTIKLRANGLFKEIKNLKVSFYYFNYEKDKYELIKEVLIPRHFSAGGRENFSVTLENIPVQLIKDNFFKKGEFIISELSDYEIPEMHTTYKQLLASIKEKSIPLVFNTPGETTIYYVGQNSKALSFNQILTTLFPNQFELKEDELVKLKQFSNNLGDYTYLSEIKKLDKKGKWFLLTNRLNQHYLDYKFTPKDHLILSYITGSELANQKEEMIFSFREQISGEENFKEYPLGNVTPNSVIDIQIRPDRAWGVTKEHMTEVFDHNGGNCGRNCVSLPIYCKWEINKMTSYDERWQWQQKLDALTGKLELAINGELFNLAELAAKKLISVKWTHDNLHLQIRDISKIKPIVSYEENLIALRVNTKKEFDFWGVKLVKAERSGSRGIGGCAYTTPMVAQKFGVRFLSRESILWNEMQITYDQILNDEGRRNLTIKRADNYYQRVAVSVSSTIKNNFN